MAPGQAVTIAHQNLAQFDRNLVGTIMASTTIKLAGGVSARDATAYAREMRCEPEDLQAMRKGERHTEFACFVRHVTERPVTLTVPFGSMERLPKLSPLGYAHLRELNRVKHCSGAREVETYEASAPADAGFKLGEWERL